MPPPSLPSFLPSLFPPPFLPRRLLECAEGICDRPEVMMGLYTQSTFCIMAPGWLPARRAAFDALLAGCIPVMLDDFLSKQASGGEGGRGGR